MSNGYPTFETLRKNTGMQIRPESRAGYTQKVVRHA